MPLRKLLSFLRREKQAPRTWSLLYMPAEEQAGVPAPALAQDAPRAYSQHGWVYACVRAIAQAASSVPLRVWRSNSAGERRPAGPTHPLRRLLTRVNPRHTFPELMEATVVALELAGNAYWALERDSLGRVAEIWPMRPDRVKIVPGRNLVEGYIYEANGRQVSFAPEEVLHFRYFSPADDFYGLSPLSAAADSVATDLYAVAYNQSFFRRGARPEGVITSQVQLSEEELKRLRAQFEEVHAGVDRAHRVLILGSDLQWQNLGVAPRDADFLQQRKLSREEICAVFGVPPAIVGIYQYANYANAQLQRKLFWADTIVPKLQRIAGVINERLVPQFAAVEDGVERLAVEFDLNAVPALQEDAREQADVAATLVREGILTADEARERFYDLPPRGEVSSGAR
ncbi:MAG: phage portal protein [Armatimonadetes bacterium]|nr:phage portal protein [Armatimonadota bacterium]